MLKIHRPRQPRRPGSSPPASRQVTANSPSPGRHPESLLHAKNQKAEAEGEEGLPRTGEGRQGKPIAREMRSGVNERGGGGGGERRRESAREMLAKEKLLRREPAVKKSPAKGRVTGAYVVEGLPRVYFLPRSGSLLTRVGAVRGAQVWWGWVLSS